MLSAGQLTVSGYSECGERRYPLNVFQIVSGAPNSWLLWPGVDITYTTSPFVSCSTTVMPARTQSDMQQQHYFETQKCYCNPINKVSNQVLRIKFIKKIVSFTLSNVFFFNNTLEVILFFLCLYFTWLSILTGMCVSVVNKHSLLSSFGF